VNSNPKKVLFFYLIITKFSTSRKAWNSRVLPKLSTRYEQHLKHINTTCCAWRWA